jgi:hypothetical protein
VLATINWVDVRKVKLKTGFFFLSFWILGTMTWVYVVVL